MDKSRSWKCIPDRGSKNQFGVGVVKEHGMILYLQKIMENVKNTSIQYSGTVSREDSDNQWERLDGSVQCIRGMDVSVRIAIYVHVYVDLFNS